MVIATLAILLLLYGMTPKGTLLHEALYLPWFWLSVAVARKAPTKVTRIPYGNHPRQYYLLCQPPDGKVTQTKLIIYFHGGSWRWGKPDLFKAHAGFFNQLGYAVIMPSYRPCPKHNYQHIRKDLETLLESVHSEVAKQKLPCKTAITGGMSAGGHLAMLLALNPSFKNAEVPQGWIEASFALGAPLHLEAMPHSFVIEDFAGDRDKSMFAQATPYTYATERPGLPILIVHGTQDGMVPYSSTKGFVLKRQSLPHTPLTFVKIYKGTHLSVAGWIVYQKSKTRTALKDWLEEV